MCELSSDQVFAAQSALAQRRRLRHTTTTVLLFAITATDASSPTAVTQTLPVPRSRWADRRELHRRVLEPSVCGTTTLIWNALAATRSSSAS